MKKFLFVLLFIPLDCFSQNEMKPNHKLENNSEVTNSSTIELVEKKFFKNLITENIQIIDVRTPKEYEEGHIINAVNINYKASDFIQEISDLDKKKPYLIYCKSGNRSEKATKIMDSLGFYKIYDLKGGFMNW
ncbi:MAG: rhodanese-like domain-containing protein [Flavobacteriaceae bacterium]|nr:rhodanese-like domain-containing protein [Flavobacteriaceae bacterium]